MTVRGLDLSLALSLIAFGVLSTLLVDYTLGLPLVVLGVLFIPSILD